MTEPDWLGDKVNNYGKFKRETVKKGHKRENRNGQKRPGGEGEKGGDG